MGILNVTPDSFSDGGRYFTLDKALDHARAMAAAGADIIDIGGESTRPGARSVSAQEELDRLEPVVQAVRKESDVALSIDTSKAEVMRLCKQLDVDLINDVCALTRPAALEAAAASGLPICLMHKQGEPGTMQDNPQYDDLMAEVASFFKARIASCAAAGISRDRLLLDFGFGFGKTPAHNLTLLNRLPEFLSFGCPLLVGLSRKSTIAKLAQDLLSGSLAGAVAAVLKGARVVRVHDVAPTVAALSVVTAMQQQGQVEQR